MAGPAGTGKTIVALHRTVYLARKDPTATLLLTTFSEPLAHALQARLRILLSSEPRLGERIEVYSMDAIGRRLFERNIGPVRIASEQAVDTLLVEAAAAVSGHTFTQRFLKAEWEQVVDGWQLDAWEAYRDVPRLGRKTRLKESQRAILWSIFEQVRSGLIARGLMTDAGMFNMLASHYRAGAASPFSHVVVDESQDVSISQLRFLNAIALGQANGLFFAGDLGQRIFQTPFSWKAAGVDIQGRSTTLKINYRTSHQIRSQSDRLLASQVVDVDGNAEERSGTMSVFNGPHPELHVMPTIEAERHRVSQWLSQCIKDGIKPQEIANFVRSASEVGRAKAAAAEAKLDLSILDEQVSIQPGRSRWGPCTWRKVLSFARSP